MLLQTQNDARGTRNQRPVPDGTRASGVTGHLAARFDHTRAVTPGEDGRAGRWWWESPEHRECGLHVIRGRFEAARDLAADRVDRAAAVGAS